MLLHAAFNANREIERSLLGQTISVLVLVLEHFRGHSHSIDCVFRFS